MKYFSIFRRQKKKEEREKLELYLKEEKKRYLKESAEPKLLILGSSDSGKSTLLKQMKLLYYGGFKENELIDAKWAIRLNLMESIKFFWEILDSNEIKQKYDTLKTFADFWNKQNEYPEEFIDLFEKFWKEPVISKIYENSKTLPCTVDYYLNDLRRFLQPDFVPTNDDVLNLRVTTYRISDTVFEMKNKRIHFFDVSGLKYHRTRWVAYFDTAETILFVTSLSCYDQTLVEDPTINRAADAIALFQSVCNMQLLEKTGIILFLNKRDLFEKKVRKIPIKSYFPEYGGREFSVTDGLKFFQQKYMASTKSRMHFTSYHYICCTDTDSMSKLLTDIM
jgi:GTPase SAR1 family protein